MSRSTRLIVVVTLLLSIGLISRAEPVSRSYAAPRSAGPALDVDGDALDAFISAGMRTARIPGLSLAVVRGEQVAYLKGYGIAGPNGRPVTPQTSFILGSTSKSFTALAVMQLVEAGRIDLDASVTTYLPWFRTDDAAESARITVGHLLHHTSGLTTRDGLRGLSAHDLSTTALENGIRALSSAHLRQSPGQRYEYANENYDTLGMIIQAVSGISYEEYIRSAIFAPLRMRHSAAVLSDASAADLATGYRYWLLWPLAFDAPYPRRATPAGYLISSAEDMSHYVISQLNGGAYGPGHVLSPQGVVRLHTPASRINPTTSYGMGWAIRSAPGSTRLWHDGNVSNFHSHVRLLPDHQLGFIVLMNVGGFGNHAAIENLVEGIGATLLGQSPAAPASSPSSSFSRLTRLVPLLVAILWAGWSYRSLRRWHRGGAARHGIRRFLGLYLPLAVELSVVGTIWILLPASVEVPIATIALFTPDVFAVLIAVTSLAVGCAIARTLTVTD